MNVPEIYNAYLGTSRRAMNQPWKARKNFDGFEKTPDGIICRKLELFFKKFPQISPHEFFKAPYEVYKDDSTFPLNFYTTQKAIAVYTALQKQKQEESPDTENQIKSIKESLKYIASYCIEKGITLEQYCKGNSSYVQKPFVDFAEKRLNIYVLIKLPFFDTQLNSLNLQDKELYLKETFNSIAKYKMRLNTSSRAKSLIDEGLRIISNTTNTIDKTKN
jgi:hypothetical protein